MTNGQRISETFLAVGGWLVFALAPAAAQSAPDKEEIKLQTRDGVKIAISYYPSALGKEAVPVVMLHDFKENRNVFGNVADALQNPGGSDESHAVITVDLRGHGESTVQVAPNGNSRDLEASRLRQRDFQLMVSQDMEAVRRFLVEKNDQGDLNLNSLTLVGSGMGANVAIHWAAADWATPQLATRKQGQDVKAMVVFSPEWSFKGLPLLQPLRQPGLRSQVSFLIVYGEQFAKAKRDANNLYKNLKKYHPDPPPDKVTELKDLFTVPVPTKLQGTKLLNSDESNLLPDVQQFIGLRVVDQKYGWVRRK